MRYLLTANNEAITHGNQKLFVRFISIAERRRRGGGERRVLKG